MCAIVGLHLRNPESCPRLGELLTAMPCEMSNRGSDSAGVAVYGDPSWTPPGRGCVSLLNVDVEPDTMCATVDRVAMGSEYRALSGLPGVEGAVIWEPEPEVVYAWTR